MTYTIEINATEERELMQAATARGVGLDAYLLQAAREMAALDAQEDAEDLADARRVVAQTTPEDYVSWESLKAEMDARKAA